MLVGGSRWSGKSLQVWARSGCLGKGWWVADDGVLGWQAWAKNLYKEMLASLESYCHGFVEIVDFGLGANGYSKLEGGWRWWWDQQGSGAVGWWLRGS